LIYIDFLDENRKKRQTREDVDKKYFNVLEYEPVKE